jgi:peptidoglycan hydrolase-like protein with peptidoglycan-binding domain
MMAFFSFAGATTMRRSVFLFGPRATVPLCGVLTVLFAANLFFFQGERSTAPSGLPLASSAPVAPARTLTKTAQHDDIAAVLSASVESIKPVGRKKSPPIQPADPKLVMALQRHLAEAGYQAGGETGIADLMTRGAILAFEQENGLPLTAEPSPTLLKNLLMGAPKKRVANKDAGPAIPAGPQAVALIGTTQGMLRKLGYRTGSDVGAVSEQTGKAIKQFEAASGLPPTGRISGALLAELSRMSGTRLDMASGDLVD